MPRTAITESRPGAAREMRVSAALTRVGSPIPQLLAKADAPGAGFGGEGLGPLLAARKNRRARLLDAVGERQVGVRSQVSAHRGGIDATELAERNHALGTALGP